MFDECLYAMQLYVCEISLRVKNFFFPVSLFLYNCPLPMQCFCYVNIATRKLFSNPSVFFKIISKP